MNLKALERKLIETARTSVPDEHVPYAFEKRIMARLADVAPLSWAGLWGHALWRGAVPCVAVAVLLCAWSLWRGVASPPSGDFPREFETAVLVASDQSSVPW